MFGLIAGIASSIFSANAQKSAAQKAAGAQTRASTAQIAETRRQFDVIQGLLKPYVTAGTGGLQAQLDLMGIGGGGTAPGIETIQIPKANGIAASQQFKVGGQTFKTMAEAQAYAGANRTGGIGGQEAQRLAIEGIANGSQFQAMAAQGEEALLANASATGGLRGGNTQGALAQFRPQMLQSLIDMQLAQFGGLAANGQNAAGMTGTAAQNAGAQINASLGDRGAAQAGAHLAVGQANQNMFGGIMNSVGQYAGSPQGQKFFGNWGGF